MAANSSSCGLSIFPASSSEMLVRSISSWRLKQPTLFGFFLFKDAMGSAAQHEDDDSSGGSIFFGLVALETLNLKDNNLSSSEECSGLVYFSMRSNGDDNDNNENNG